MAKELFANNPKTLLTAALSGVATTVKITLGDGAKFPNPTAGDWFMLTLIDVSSGAYEICKCTARGTDGVDDLLTVTRAQEGTSALTTLVAGDKAEARLTKGTMERLPQLGAPNTFSDANTFSVPLTVATPTAGGHAVTKDYAEQHGFTTGDVKVTTKTVPDTGWVLFNDTTIGSATSGATGRANADTEALFTHLWTVSADHECPVSGGRGASAAADFAANKTLALPKAVGRALAVYGTGSQVETYTGVTAAGNAVPIAGNNTKWITGMPVTLTGVSGFGTLVNGSYWLIRADATHVGFATSLANAQNGIKSTVTGTGDFTMTYSLTARVLGEVAGEEAHAMSSTELLAHTHPYDAPPGGASPGSASGSGDGLVGRTTSSTGGNAAMNIMGPTLFLNAMIRL